MDVLQEKFEKPGVENAPGQESLQEETNLDFRGEKLYGEKVDFSHGDVDAVDRICKMIERYRK